MSESDGPSWAVPTGRRDGRVSSKAEASNLPSPTDSIAVQRQKFMAKGLDDHDLVTLVGNAFKSDQRLLGEAATGRIVQNYAGSIRGLLGLRFDLEFPKAMIK
ncbi:hypothetical protein RHSIM_Rhsim03G0027700 [Rhododendron simsii]|uniref:peroxidase n=1 Tax=Rhododendron simsii TaxID=118357 RepID=A0A834HDZ3_RHOSS|nr:hypothetical protein RHSIM_Rhsim03G0027700 [Rhododendron simsii]